MNSATLTNHPISSESLALFWQFTEDAAWHESHNNKAIADRLHPQWQSQSKELHQIFQQLQRRLMNALDESRIELPVSDDGFDDLTAHVIGMGRKAYEEVLENPAAIQKYLKSYVENFSYILLNLMDS